MIETVQLGCVQDAMPDFEVMKNLMEDDSEIKICEQEIIEIQEIHSREDERDPKLRKRFVRGPLRRPWSRHMNLDETYREVDPIDWTAWQCF